MSETGARRDDRGRVRRQWPAAQLRIGLAGLIGVNLAVVASQAFDEFVWQLLIPPVAVTLAAFAMRTRRHVVRAAVESVVVLAAVSVATVLAGASAGELASGWFSGPRRLLTTEWPSPRDPAVLLAVALLVGAIVAVAADLAGRPTLHSSPLIVTAAGLAATIAIAAPVRPPLWAMLVLAVTGIVMLLFPSAGDAAARLRLLLSERSLPAVLAALAVVGGISASGLAWADRADPRRPPPAETTRTVLNAVEQIVAIHDAQPSLELFRVTDRSTLIAPSLPTRWRTAALDTYDGQRWVPTLTMRPIGDRLSLPPAAGPSVVPPVQFDIEYLTNDFDTVPIPGRALEVDAGDLVVETDATRTAVRFTDRPDRGQRVRVVALPAPSLSDVQAAPIGTRQVDELAAEFTDVARAVGGDGTVLDQLQRLEAAMRDEWQLDSNVPGGGQQMAQLSRFVTVTQRGTQQQFVSAFVLLARSLGVDARLATGFVVPPDELASPLTLRSTHAAAWPEVRVVDVGWFAFDPVPAVEASDVEPPPPPPSAQSAAAVQPPVQPAAERADAEQQQVIQATDGPDRWDRVRTWMARGILGGGAALLPIALMTSGLLGFKWWRRRRRERVTDPVRRTVGAWANATDSLVDAGLAISPAWTDDGIALAAAELAPGVPHELRRLAAMSTAMTFGQTGDGWRLAGDAVTTRRAIDAAIGERRNRWRRIRWRLSVRSLRTTTRSPIRPPR